MPVIIKAIDEIARQKQRDVLWIRFHDWQNRNPDKEDVAWNTPVRQQVLKFLDEHHITHQPCFPFFDNGVLAWPYEGDVYVDVPFSSEDPDFKKISAYLESDSSGTPTIDGAWLCAFSLEKAMKHAERDTDEFWENNI